MIATDDAVRSRSRRRLVLVATAFAAPMLIAYALYYGGWRPQAVHPTGELVTPPRPVADVELVTLDKRPVRFSSFQHRWVLLYLDSSECIAICERALYNMRQVIAAQGSEAGRVQAVMVATDAHALDMLRYQLKDYPEVTALVGPISNVARLAREFELPTGGALSGLRRVYLVDPLGNFMMSYPADANPGDMRKDLTRLLRVSQIG
jgi:cytochrome oxidase Cu insertion factor (SCO1/SenC/PrrC family)